MTKVALPGINALQQQLYLLERQSNLAAATSGDYDDTLIRANTDADALASYLRVRCQKATTRKTVLGAIRKLLVYMSLNNISTLADWKTDECEQFRQWLVAPPPDLCSGNKPTPIWLKQDQVPNPNWKPFRKALSETAANQCIGKINALFQYLLKAGYLAGNPWQLVRNVGTQVKSIEDGETERELPLPVIRVVLQFLKESGDFLGVSAAQRNRWQWWFTFYLYTGARLTSGCLATVEDIYTDRRGYKQLTLTVKGAGVRRKDVPWNTNLDTAYQNYRESIGLTPIILGTRKQRRSPNEPISPCLQFAHLLLPLNLKAYTDEPLSYAAVHKQIIQLFQMTRQWVLANNIELEEHELGILEDATGHWIRHGTATLLGPELAQQQLGHSTRKQTEDYIAAKRETHLLRLSSLVTQGDDQLADTIAFLTALPVQKRASIVGELMKTIEAEEPEELDRLWANFNS